MGCQGYLPHDFLGASPTLASSSSKVNGILRRAPILHTDKHYMTANNLITYKSIVYRASEGELGCFSARGYLI